MDELARALQEAGGADAAPASAARLGSLLDAELRRGARELELARSGYDAPVTAAFAADHDGVLAVVPVDPALRADPAAVDERAFRLAAAAVGALADAGGDGGGDGARLTAGSAGTALVLRLAGDPEAELAALAFEDQVAPVDRLRARALAFPVHAVHPGDLRTPIGATHPLLVALAVARAGGRPADPADVERHEEAVLAVLAPAAAAHAVRPHDDPDPARRVARRILQRLDGMGKWGGYHTDIAHLSRGFAGNDRALADEIGARLLAAGLLSSKPSVGQRHVFLDPGRAADIRALIDRGEAPEGLHLT